MAMGWMRFPLHEVERLHREINGLFRSHGLLPGLVTGAEYPAVNVSMSGSDIVVRAEMPGMSMEQIDITLVGNVLTIRGERVADTEVSLEAYQRRERGFGPFVRSVRLPERVEGDKAEAHFADGMLEVRVPKSPEAQPRRIAVQAQGALPEEGRTSK